MVLGGAPLGTTPLGAQRGARVTVTRLLTKTLQYCVAASQSFSKSVTYRIQATIAPMVYESVYAVRRVATAIVKTVQYEVSYYTYSFYKTLTYAVDKVRRLHKLLLYKVGEPPNPQQYWLAVFYNKNNEIIDHFIVAAVWENQVDAIAGSEWYRRHKENYPYVTSMHHIEFHSIGSYRRKSDVGFQHRLQEVYDEVGIVP